MHDGGTSNQTEETFFVGIGASAGGLEAASLLVQNLPQRAGAVYVLAQHMSPTHKSLLTSLIARETDLPVVELGEPIIPSQDTIYVVPPNSDVELIDGQLHLRAPGGPVGTPIPSADRLFKSLAAECGDRCVAIVLSGTGSDGSYGVQSVREAGGITIAQDTSSAKYDGMPSSAIESGCVDLTLTPEQIGQHLKKILATPRDLDALRKINETPSRLNDLLQILNARTQIDFREYKENTINRRIARRMVALGIKEYDEYVDFCRQSENEVDALYRDLLISVTRFFRDPQQFAQLRDVITELVAEHDNRQIRVWVAGCATGEEAYSIAILFAEAFGGVDLLQKLDIQIFASDIDDRALEIARRGTYPITALNDIPKEYVEKYFEVHGSVLEVSRAVRNVVLFSHHNLAQDPPFINCHMVSLRNVLIYFNAMLQEKVLNRVHYALNPGGSLFLGTSESVGAMHPYFENRSGAEKVYSKRLITARETHAFAESAHGRYLFRPASPSTAAKPRDAASTQMFDALARAVAKNGFISTSRAEIIRVFGDITNILEITEDSSLSLSTRILKEGLRDEATSLISVTIKHKEIRTGRWHSSIGPNDGQVRLVAYPILSPTGGEDQVLFSLETRPMESSRNLHNLTQEERIKYVNEIEAEMASTQETLQQTVEELQTSNEELQSVNEELQSTNEELQATNEELETSNEELQSTNEELITVNEEMQVNSAELFKVTTELSAILTNSPYAILIVDPALIVRRCSDTAKEFFGFGELPKNGLHLSQCVLPLGFPSLTPICNDALKFQENRRYPVVSGGKQYTLLTTPYKDSHDQIMGLELTIIEYEYRAPTGLSEAMVHMSDTANWRIDLKTNTLHWSDRVFEVLGLPPGSPTPSLENFVQHFYSDDRSRVSRHISKAASEGNPFSFEARLVRDNGDVVNVEVAGYVMRDEVGNPSYIAGAFRNRADEIRNITTQRQLVEGGDDLKVGFFSFDIENKKPYWSAHLYQILGLDPKSHVPSVEGAIEIVHPDYRETVANHMERAIKDGKPFSYSAKLLRADGEIIDCACFADVVQGDDGSPSHIYGHFRLLDT